MVWSLVYYRRRDAVLLKNTTHGYGLEYGSNGTKAKRARLCPSPHLPNQCPRDGPMRAAVGERGSGTKRQCCFLPTSTREQNQRRAQHGTASPPFLWESTKGPTTPAACSPPCPFSLSRAAFPLNGKSG